MLLFVCFSLFAPTLAPYPSFSHIYPFIVRGVCECVWNPSAHANRMWNEPFSCCIYYICLKTCHVGIYLVNQIMPRNDMLMKWQSVYSIFVLLFLPLLVLLCVSLCVLCFMFFFLGNQKKCVGKCKHFPLREILINSTKIHLLSRKFWDREKNQHKKGWMPFI